MHEDLLGYLLGALEPHEMRRVEEILRTNSEARRELERLEKMLEPLEETAEPIEPPPIDLVARTMANLPPLPSPNQPIESESTSKAVEDDSGQLVPMNSGIDAPKTTSMTWIDWASGCVAAAVLLGLLLPSLAQGRFLARRSACQDNMRQWGTVLTNFANRNQQGCLPAVSESGPEAFAGVYAVRLYEAGLVDDPTLRWCPSVDLPSQEEISPQELNQLVSVDQLHQASVDRLRQIQRFVGGHYAYTLGVIDKNHFTPPRFESRSSFAVMSDAPMVGMQGGEIAADRIGHSGFGINVLYEDGRVQFLTLSSLDTMLDHPLMNHRAQPEAGVNIDDASLAPSWHPPFLNVRQR